MKGVSKKDEMIEGYQVDYNALEKAEAMTADATVKKNQLFFLEEAKKCVESGGRLKRLYFETSDGFSCDYTGPKRKRKTKGPPR